ncbi:MAG: hypothetical protein Edafosvirus34_13, partial [Edafosvirus sp.]
AVPRKEKIKWMTYAIRCADFVYEKDWKDVIEVPDDIPEDVADIDESKIDLVEIFQFIIKVHEKYNESLAYFEDFPGCCSYRDGFLVNMGTCNLEKCSHCGGQLGKFGDDIDSDGESYEEEVKCCRWYGGERRCSCGFSKGWYLNTDDIDWLDLDKFSIDSKKFIGYQCHERDNELDE